MPNPSLYTSSISLSQSEIEFLLSIPHLQKPIHEKLQKALNEIQETQIGVMAICTLNDAQKDALCLSVDILRKEHLFYSEAARNAAVWWMRGGRAIIWKLEKEHESDLAFYGLELIPPQQSPDLRPEQDGFQGLNLGWFDRLALAHEAAVALGLNIVFDGTQNR